jgi:membrane protein DedA with SNARE-associated domain
MHRHVGGKGQAVPWEGRPERADLVCAGAILFCVAYSIALIPAIPQLVGRHPVLLSLLSGSVPAQVASGALARVGGTSLLVAFLAGVPGVMMFDPLFWWAGRRWGRRGAAMLVGRGARAERLMARGERLGERWGPLAVILAYYLPIPNVLVYALVGWTGMRLATFIVLDVIGAALWTALMVGLGYAIGQSAVDVAHAISHYALLATIVLFALIFARQAFTRRG